MMVSRSQVKFGWTLFAIEIVFIVFFGIFVRYSPEISDSDVAKENLEDSIESSYAMSIDIQIMLFLGFGYLTTYLRRFCYSALVITMMIVCLAVQASIVIFGMIRMDENFNTFITWNDITEGGFAAAAVLISFGAVMGKVTPIQMLCLTLFETVCYCVNYYIGYELFQVVDSGGAIYIHVFGAYFGVFASLAFRTRSFKDPLSVENQQSSYISNVFAFLGTLLLWVYWPSFNAFTVSGAARERSIINTYLSMTASTLTVLVLSILCNKNRKFIVSYIQNATLAGGVAVGAVSHLQLQPYGSLIAGSVSGVISALGMKYIQDPLYSALNLHDTCGVHNLHGMPGVLSGLLSVIMAFFANEKNYGSKLFEMYPAMAPRKTVEDSVNDFIIEPGLERSSGQQALYQFVGLVVTLILASLTGLFSGAVVQLKRLCDPVEGPDQFSDELVFEMPEEEDSFFESFWNKRNQPHFYKPSSTAFTTFSGDTSLMRSSSVQNESEFRRHWRRFSEHQLQDGTSQTNEAESVPERSDVHSVGIEMRETREQKLDGDDKFDITTLKSEEMGNDETDDIEYQDGNDNVQISIVQASNHASASLNN